MHVEQHSSVPEDGIEQPGEWQGGSWPVNQKPVAQWRNGISLVGEVQQQNVDKVEHQNNLRPEEVVLYKQQCPHENTQVENGKVPANELGESISVGHARAVCRRQKDLGDERNLGKEKNRPVQQSEHEVRAIWCVTHMVWVVLIKGRSSNKVSESRVYCKHPGEDGGHFVDEKIVLRSHCDQRRNFQSFLREY